MIAIVDYGLGNLHSVLKAFEAIGEDACLVSTPEELADAHRIVLPGVGAFGQGMQNLQELGLTEALREQVMVQGKPFLGVCLGMQLLAREGHEHGVCPGLGWLDASVEPLDVAGANLNLPHIGWNEVYPTEDSPLFRGLGPAPVFYFVHGYHLAPRSQGTVIATCDYGGNFAAAIQQDNILATQFHPEKSQVLGLRLLENFVDWES